MNKKAQKGVSLYLTIFIMAALIAVVLGMSTILFKSMKMVGEMQYSVIAFCAADTGIEKVLDSDLSIGENATGTLLEGDAEWEAMVVGPGTEGWGVLCPAEVNNFCIHSRGTYKEVKRAIQISR